MTTTHDGNATVEDLAQLCAPLAPNEFHEIMDELRQTDLTACEIVALLTILRPALDRRTGCRSTAGPGPGIGAIGPVVARLYHSATGTRRERRLTVGQLFSLLLFVGFVVAYFRWIAAAVVTYLAYRWARAAWVRHCAAADAWKREQRGDCGARRPTARMGTSR